MPDRAELLEETMEPDGHTHRQVMFKPEMEIRPSSQARTREPPGHAGRRRAARTSRRIPRHRYRAWD
jgi:hypothetical protein